MHEKQSKWRFVITGHLCLIYSGKFIDIICLVCLINRKSLAFLSVYLCCCLLVCLLEWLICSTYISCQVKSRFSASTLFFSIILNKNQSLHSNMGSVGICNFFKWKISRFSTWSLQKINRSPKKGINITNQHI